MTEKALSIIIQREDLPQLFGKRVESQAAIEEVISKIETESRSITFDINTKDGQATCRSLAAKIASAKSTLDKAGKAKKDEYTVTTKLIDADRNLAKSRLQALQDEIRQPLTALEQREAQRKAQHEANLAALIDFADLVGCVQEFAACARGVLLECVGCQGVDHFSAELVEKLDRDLRGVHGCSPFRSLMSLV